MEAGRYWVGDLCYVLSDDEWDDVCELTIKGNNVIDGEFQLPSGKRFSMISTEYGDGTYDDQYGNSYPVDSGSLGCILLSDISEVSDLGNVHNFSTNFACSRDEDGVVRIGHIFIPTS